MYKIRINITCLLLLCTLVVHAKNDSIKKDFIKIGGAVRFNAVMENYESSNNDLDTYAKMDTWFLSVDAHQKGFDLSLQYRFYPESKTHFIHHAYIGYQIDSNWYLKLGVFQKPFGIGDFASHSWWFQVPYYLGWEDTYNTGIGAFYKKDKLTIDAAYFRQAAPRGSISSNADDNSVGNGRYSYAIVPTYGYSNGEKADANIRELDQFNGRIRYQILPQVELGFSGEWGSIYNKTLNKRKWGFSWAAHTLINYDRWNLKGEIIGYNYNAQSDDNRHLDIVQMAAYGSAYDVAAKGFIYVAGVSYTIPVNRRFISSIQSYIDYSVVHKSEKSFHDTQQIVPGMLITSGPIYTYIDYAIGKNHPWLTSNFGEGLGEGSADARWNSRLNINIGYYF